MAPNDVDPNAVDPNAAPPNPDPNAAPDPNAVDDGKKKSPPWFVTAIAKEREEKDRLQGSLSTKDAEIATLNAALEAAKRGANPNPNPDPGGKAAPSQADIDKMVDERAAKLATEAQFNASCNKAYDQGKQEFTDFDQAVNGLTAVGATKNRTFLEAVTKLPESHKLLHRLGTNLEDAARIVSLPPLDMAIELAKISGQLTAPRVSGAPDPIRGRVGGRANPGIDLASKEVPMSDWMTERNKQLEARNGSRR